METFDRAVFGRVYELFERDFDHHDLFSAYGQPLPYVVGTYDVPSYQNVFEQGDVLLSVNGKQINLMAQEDLDNVFKKVGDNAEFRVLRNGKRIKITASKFFYDPFEDGDYIYAVDGKKLDTPVAYADYLATVESNDAFIVTVVRYDEKGEICEQSTMKVQKGANPEDANGFYSYGFGITRTIARAKLPFFLAFGRAWSFCFFIVFKILASFGALITGKMGIEGAGGTITTIITMAKVSALGFESFMYVVAIISANLAVMNLLPFPALDGSRMLFTLIEMIFKKPVPRKVEAVIHTVGLVLLLVLAVFLDVFHLVKR